jgi:signal peptidase complex subunit 1
LWFARAPNRATKLNVRHEFDFFDSIFHCDEPHPSSLEGVTSARARLRDASGRLVSENAMDFQGQRLSERMYQICIVMFAILGFVVGYGTGSFRAMMACFGAGVVIAIVIAVPDWKYFNQHPQRWLRADAREKQGGGKGKRR